ncbi:MAG: SUMF1/EgtB/PvdO family nonheme iron enzyme [Spirochaetia bacterium]|nr:SUMF1/EgtB/PvdO family nonheme iron enzyme [Spirochaetia bacterium]
MKRVFPFLSIILFFSCKVIFPVYEVTDFSAVPQDGAVILSFVTPDRIDPDYRYFYSHVTVEYGVSGTALTEWKGDINPAGTLIGNLKNGVYYTFLVKVVDRNGIVSDGVSLDVMPIDTSVPPPVEELTVSSGFKKVTLFWYTPGGYDIASVRIQTVRRSDHYPVKTQTVAVKEWYYAEAPVTGLQNDTEYLFFVSAVNSFGNISEPVSLICTPDGDAPGDPEDVKAVILNSANHTDYPKGGAVRIEYFLPRINSIEITDYDYTEIFYAKRGYLPDKKAVNKPEGTSVGGFYRESVIIDGLENGIEYGFLLKAYDKAGNSSAGIFVYAVPYSDAVPAGLSRPPLVSRYAEQALLSWVTPEDVTDVYLYSSENSFVLDPENFSVGSLPAGVQKIDNPIDLGVYLDYPQTTPFYYMLVLGSESSPFSRQYAFWPEDAVAVRVEGESDTGTETLLPVKNLSAESRNQAVCLKWTGNVTDDSVYIGFLWSADAAALKAEYEKFDGSVIGKFDIPSVAGAQMREITGLPNRTEMTFAVFAYNADGVKSAPVYIQTAAMPTAGPVGDPPVLPGGTGLPMSMIPSGEYFSGADGLVSVREIKLTNDFLMYRFETEYELWRVVYEWAVARGYRFYSPGKEANGGSYGTAATPGAGLPVVGISWYDAVVWCNALTEYYNSGNPPEKLIPVYLVAGSVETDHYDQAVKNILKDISGMSSSSSRDTYDRVVFNRSGTGFRLPTEAEWEYAAGYIDGSRRQAGEAYSCGIDYIDDQYSVDSNGEWKFTPRYNVAGIQTVHRYVWYGSTPRVPDAYNNEGIYIDTSSGGRIHGEKDLYIVSDGDRDNAVGLVNMSGNVYEWVWDWYVYFPYHEGQIEYCIDPSGPVEPAAFRVRRGGSAYDNLQYARICFRGNDVPTGHRNDSGFRFVRTVK